MKVAQSCLTLCDPCTRQSMEFSRPEYRVLAVGGLVGKLVGVAESALTAGGDFGAMSHTILLVQPTERPEGRT